MRDELSKGFGRSKEDRRDLEGCLEMEAMRDGPLLLSGVRSENALPRVLRRI